MAEAGTAKKTAGKKETPEDEINLVWLGRFAGSKEMSVYNIIQNFAYMLLKYIVISNYF